MAKINDLSDFSVSLYLKPMDQLNLPDSDFRTRKGKNGKNEIFDPYRKKFVSLTPEEGVRQHFLSFMVHHLDFPASLIVVEAAISYNRMKKRFDILAYNSNGKPCMVVECKAPSVDISQDVFDQAAMYNMSLGVEYLVVTNGLKHFACRIDHEKRNYSFLPEIPDYMQMTKSQI